MKKLFLAALLAASMPLCAQNTNPQPGYAQTMSIRKPSTWLRFNGSSATTFTDAVAGNNFSAMATFGQLPTPTLSAGGGFAVFNSVPLQLGALSAITTQEFAACTGTITIVIGTNSGSPTVPNITITDSFNVTLAATTSVQTFHAGTDFSPRNVTSGQLAGYWTPSTATCNIDQGAGSPSYYFLNSASTLPSGTVFYGVGTGTNVPDLEATITSPITPLQPGFDLNQKNNFSAAFAASGWAVAPNASVGDFDWFTPHSFDLYVDGPTINRLGGGTITLASKGDFAHANGWVLDLEPDTADGFPLAYRVCYRENGVTATAPGHVQQSVCTGQGSNAIADGTGFTVQFADAGTGWINDDHLYVNGLDGGGLGTGSSYNTLFANGFGYLSIAISGGTGYPTATPLVVTGGGPNCVIDLSMLSIGGVPTGNFTGTRNSGCTTTPTSCGLAASSGTGAVLTCTVVPATLSNTEPLYVGAPTGISTDSAQSPIDIDEFAIFPSFLSVEDAVNLYYSTNWYQQILGTPPATPPLVIFSDDGSPDPDNQYALATAVRAHQLGYIKLVGLINQDITGSCSAMWRQMLDQAGLNQVPVAVINTFAGGGGGCNSGGTEIATYNASTPTASTAYVDSTTLYRTILAKYPSTAVQIFNSSNQFTDLANFMQSPADGISPLTGQQLFDQDAANGAGVYAQGATYCVPTSPPLVTPCTASYSDPSVGFDWASVQYVLTHNGSMPVYWVAGTPYVTGQDLPNSRTAKDPIFLYSSVQGPRQGWDTLTFLPTFINKFIDGLILTASGGTGYADYTPITQTGGGPDCPSQLGWMHATGGVPDGIQFPGGGDSNATYLGVYVGVGGGCTSVPTLSLPGATGTGVTLTPHLNSVCGTITITLGSPNTTVDMTSATCSNHFFVQPSATSVESPDVPWFLWFVNSLMDPPPVGQPRNPD